MLSNKRVTKLYFYFIFPVFFFFCKDTIFFQFFSFKNSFFSRLSSCLLWCRKKTGKSTCLNFSLFRGVFKVVFVDFQLFSVVFLLTKQMSKKKSSFIEVVFRFFIENLNLFLV